jgi:DNA-binding MarR family transcriptional regulator
MPDSTPEKTTLLTETLEEIRDREAAAAEPYEPDASAQDFQRYFHGVAQAHHVIRKVFRIVDGQASKAGVEPLEHKLLIQAMGAGETALRVSDLASRLDIAPALASRLVKSLEGKGLVSRSLGQGDRRTTVVDLTWEGRRLLGEIDRDVRLHVDYFQAQLSDEERAAAVRVFAFYLGAPPSVS